MKVHETFEMSILRNKMYVVARWYKGRDPSSVF